MAGSSFSCCWLLRGLAGACTASPRNSQFAAWAAGGRGCCGGKGGIRALNSRRICSNRDRVLGLDCVYDPSTCSSNEVAVDLLKAKEEMEKLKEEAHANHDHMLQYKNIAQVNEAALKQMESAHEKFKAEADKLKKSLEAEILSLKERVFELENSCILKSEEAASSIAGKEEALHAALAEITNLKEESSERASKVMVMEIQISSLKEDLEKENQRWRMAQNNYERQVILQSETIQELTKTSQALASLQEEASELRKLADARKSENDILKATLETEKSELEKSRNESERKYSEINEQNKILHDHLEALHIKLAERERNYAGTSFGSSGSDQHGDADLQNVVQYLRRSKEIAETEISLLKQEKLRLQSQLERALKASETAQSLLHSERANSRALLFTDEEFRSLQIQVSEINLLRESNKQLREENKHNFEECQKLREMAQKARIETEHLETLVREKQIAVDACQKEVSMQIVEKKNLESRIVELLEKCKSISVEDYEHMKDDVQQMQVKMREKETEVEETKKLVSQKQDRISCLEQELANTNLELLEKEKRINDTAQVEDTQRLEFEKQKRVLSFYKKKVETLTKEKEDLSEKKSSLLKQLEDSKQGKRSVGDSTSDQAMKEKEMEKDTRIQMLEKTLERERDALRKEMDEHKRERMKRLKSEKAIMDTLSTVNKERKKVLDELELAKAHLAESGGTLIAELPSENALEEQTASYLSSVDKLEVEANSFVSDGSGAPGAAAETSSLADMPSTEITARQVPQFIAAQSTTAITVGSSLAKGTDGKEKRPNLPKSNVDARKFGRKLIRPRLGRQEESTGDIEMSEPDLPSNTEVKIGSSHDSEPQSAVSILPQISARKRLASSSPFDASEETDVQLEAGSNLTAHVPKKSKGFDSSIKGAESQPAVLPEVLEALPPVEESNDATSDLPVPCAANEETDDAEKDEVDTIKDPAEEPKDPSFDRTHQIEVQNESSAVSEELVENTRETEEDTDEGMRDGEEQDPQQSTIEDEDEREEGELMPDLTVEGEGGDILIMTVNTEQMEGLTEPGTVTDTPPAGIDEEAVAEVTEAKSPEISVDEKNGTVGELMEEVADDSDKSSGGNDQGGGDTEQSLKAMDTDQSPKATFGAGESSSPSNLAEPPVSKQGSLTVLPEIEEGKEVPGAVINLTERARRKAMLRQAGVVSQPAVVSQPTVVSQPAVVSQPGVVSPPNTRARGRPLGMFKRGGARVARGGQGARGARGGRGQASDDKGQT